MIRFFIEKKEKLICSAETTTYYSVIGEVELEKALLAGGFSENQYEVHHLLGAEVVSDPPGGQSNGNI